MKNGMEVTLGIFATTPFAPAEVSVLVRAVYASVNVVVEVIGLLVPSPPFVAYPKTSLLPIYSEKNVGCCAMASLRTLAVGEDANLTKYGLAVPVAKFAALP